jgi:hypothetical protein
LVERQNFDAMQVAVEPPQCPLLLLVAVTSDDDFGSDFGGILTIIR